VSAAPPELTEIAALTDAVLAQTLAAERSAWSGLDPAVDEPLAALEAIVAAGGKRLRPAYVHWGWVTGGGDPADERRLAGCCAVELLHAFALVHDDVMDGSDLRRGEPTVWAQFVERHRVESWRGEPRRFGEAAAILVGDIAMVLADRQLLGAHETARRVWDELRSELNMGQYLDVRGAASCDTSAGLARKIMRNKTAGYTIVRPLQLGAALAGRAGLAEDLAAHGMPLGTAFQLRDDVLGAFGDAARTGKPVGDDLREGKATVLLAEARARASAAELAVLDRVGRPGISDADVANVQQVMTDSGALAACEQEIERLGAEALAAVDALPDLHGSRAALRALAAYVVARDR